MIDLQLNAILSLTNKAGAAEFGRKLDQRGFLLFSTGGTARILREAGVPVIEISEYTGFPEGMDGRLKTLHPKVEGGILGRHDIEEHIGFQDKHDILRFDIVAVNLYDFAAAAADSTKSFEEVVDQIDIGGPTMIRAAAKNWQFCLPVVDPNDYDQVIAWIDSSGLLHGDTEFRREMQLKAFELTANYDRAIEDYLREKA